MKVLVLKTVALLSRVVTLGAVKRLDGALNSVFSAWIGSIFLSLGRQAHLERDLRVLGGKYIRIGDNFIGNRGLRIEAWDRYAGEGFRPEISIGNNVCFNYDCHLGAINSITIGDNVLVGSRVLITDHSHGSAHIQSDLEGAPISRPLVSKGPVVIEENVLIGEGVAILSGVCIGKGSVVGANSVVTKSFPPYSVIGGNPARPIRSL